MAFASETDSAEKAIHTWDSHIHRLNEGAKKLHLSHPITLPEATPDPAETMADDDNDIPIDEPPFVAPTSITPPQTFTSPFAPSTSTGSDTNGQLSLMTGNEPISFPPPKDAHDRQTGDQTFEDEGIPKEPTETQHNAGTTASKPHALSPSRENTPPASRLPDNDQTYTSKDATVPEDDNDAGSAAPEPHLLTQTRGNEPSHLPNDSHDDQTGAFEDGNVSGEPAEEKSSQTRTSARQTTPTRSPPSSSSPAQKGKGPNPSSESKDNSESESERNKSTGKKSSSEGESSRVEDPTDASLGPRRSSRPHASSQPKTVPATPKPRSKKRAHKRMCVLSNPRTLSLTVSDS